MGHLANNPARFQSRELRDVYGTFVTGVTIVTTLDKQGRPFGVTANSFSSVSLDPPLVVWSQGLKAYSYPIFNGAERFVINILARNQLELSRRFSSPIEDRFAGTDTLQGIDGLPIIAGCVAFLECRKVASFPGGDHTLYLGEVENFESSNRDPLAFSRGQYEAISPLSRSETTCLG